MLENKPDLILKNLRKKFEKHWTKIESKEVLTLFHSAAKRVPAYKDFLKKHKINVDKIKSLQDFSLVPAVDKENYLRAYPYEKLFWDGNIKRPITIHSTSGSTGEPTYFQRELKYDFRREVILENFFRLNELTISGPTLFVISFGMGVWSAGMGIYTAAYLAVNRNNFPISIVSPGVNKVEVLKILRNLASNYRQVIIAGYPPFVKDVLDDAKQEGLDLRKMNLRFIFTGEAFTEEFRDYLMSNAGIKNIYTDVMNTYGTSELGATAVETPLTVLARRLSYKNNKIFEDLFGNIIKTPTIAQYIPYFVNFECDNGELFLTGNSTIPLVKYRSGDSGGIISYNMVKEKLFSNGIDLDKEAKKLGIGQHIYELPLVYVYERRNLTTSLYGVLIYPEFVKTALFDKYLCRFFTGKFTMLTKYSKEHNQYLELNLELRKGVKITKNNQEIAVKKIVEVLRHKSSEYRELSLNMKERVYPKLVIWPYEYPKYFTPGSKQRWVVNKEKVAA